MARIYSRWHGLLVYALVAPAAFAQNSRYDISESTRPNYSNLAPWSPGVAESGDTLAAKRFIKQLGPVMLSARNRQNALAEGR